jgi:hypothetical protein
MGISLWVRCITDSKLSIGHIVQVMALIVKYSYRISFFKGRMTFL